MLYRKYFITGCQWQRKSGGSAYGLEQAPLYSTCIYSDLFLGWHIANEITKPQHFINWQQRRLKPEMEICNRKEKVTSTRLVKNYFPAALLRGPRCDSWLAQRTAHAVHQVTSQQRCSTLRMIRFRYLNTRDPQPACMTLPAGEREGTPSLEKDGPGSPSLPTYEEPSGEFVAPSVRWVELAINSTKVAAKTRRDLLRTCNGLATSWKYAQSNSADPELARPCIGVLQWQKTGLPLIGR